VQEQCRFVEQPFGGLNVLQHDALGHRLQARAFVAAQVLAGEHDHGRLGQRRIGLQGLQQLEAAHVGKVQVQHHAVERLFAQRVDGALAVDAATTSMSSWPSSATIASRSMSLSSTTSRRFSRAP